MAELARGGRVSGDRRRGATALAGTRGLRARSDRLRRGLPRGERGGERSRCDCVVRPEHRSSLDGAADRADQQARSIEMVGDETSVGWGASAADRATCIAEIDEPRRHGEMAHTCTQRRMRAGVRVPRRLGQEGSPCKHAQSAYGLSADIASPRMMGSGLRGASALAATPRTPDFAGTPPLGPSRSGARGGRRTRELLQDGTRMAHGSALRDAPWGRQHPDPRDLHGPLV